MRERELADRIEHTSIHTHIFVIRWGFDLYISRKLLTPNRFCYKMHNIYHFRLAIILSSLAQYSLSYLLLYLRGEREKTTTTIPLYFAPFSCKTVKLISRYTSGGGGGGGQSQICASRTNTNDFTTLISSVCVCVRDTRIYTLHGFFVIIIAHKRNTVISLVWVCGWFNESKAIKPIGSVE